MKSNELYKAKIEWVKSDKNGRQFTKIKIDNRDVFVHINNFQFKGSSFNVGDEINFQIEDGIRGLCAKNIKILNKNKGTKSAELRNNDTTSNVTNAPSTQGTSHSLYKVLPYNFCKRKDKRIDDGKLKQEPSQFHDRLNDGCDDIAFEITWTTLTPTAVNPCTDSDVPDNAFAEIPKGFKGYNKRWLMFDNKLAISPFTVKSAIANGFASIMGGCYRVVSGITKHDDVKEDNYPYTGKYKRYRVSMDGKSLPGILKSIKPLSNGDMEVEIQPVEEYYYNQFDPPSNIPSFIEGEKYIVAYTGKHKKVITEGKIIDQKNQSQQITAERGELQATVKYFGQYKYGMNLTLGPGGMKRHQQRFYKEDSQKSISGIIKAINFDHATMENSVYMGRFKRFQNPPDPRTNCDGKHWYENLANNGSSDQLCVNAFVYYQKFYDKQLKKDVVTNIGKNFLFKAIFSLDEAVSSDQHTCNKPDELCPRCSMFGMTNKGEDEDSPQGFRGRFKSATLVNQKILKPKQGETCQVPVFNSGGFTDKDVNITSWVDEKNDASTVSKQIPLPIQGQPKPNKRDIDGYYDKTTGDIEGAKYYLHAMVDIDDLVVKTNGKKELNRCGEPKYSHHLRNFAEVVMPKEQFTGTVGAENCTPEEIAALIILLQSSEANHGFKIGLGKAFGMGSIKSSISHVWIRSKDNYEWDSVIDLTSFLNKYKPIQTIKNYMVDILNLPNKLYKEGNDLTVPKIKTEYPDPGQGYWKNFNKSR